MMSSKPSPRNCPAHQRGTWWVGGLLPLVLLLVGCPSTASEPKTIQSAQPLPARDSLDASTASGFDEKAWEHWIDADGDCQDTREEVLIASSEIPVVFKSARNCEVASGQWTCPFTGQVISDASMVVVAALISNASAHAAGGYEWSADKRRDYANRIHGRHLMAMSREASLSKANHGPEGWLPPSEECLYLLDWISIAVEWHLQIRPSVFELQRSRCSEVPKPLVSFGKPVGLDSDSDDLQGYRFTVGANDVGVSGLGFFDSGRDGLHSDHPVGIFQVEGRRLVAKGVVPKGKAGRLEGDFRYIVIPKVVLQAKTTYVVLSYRPQSQTSDEITIGVSGLKVRPEITINSEIGRNGSGGLIFHNSPFGSSGRAWFGPSFLVMVKPE